MTEEETWQAVDAYIEQCLIPPDPALRGALSASLEGGLPEIAVSPAQGKLLYLLAKLQGARRILEIGTLGGYSTIWLARALPLGGRMTSLELSPKHARVARANLASAGLGDVVEVREGPALQSLAALETEGSTDFDMVFVDADKGGYPDYLAWSLKLTQPGAVMVFDNVVRDGAVIDAESADPNVRGVRSLYERLAAIPGLEATAIQTVGAKGYDGFILARAGGAA